MARIVPGPKPGETREFVPKSFDNHLDSDPIVFVITSPNEAQKRRLARLMRASVVLDGADVADVDEAGEAEWFRVTVDEHIKSVRNYANEAGPIDTPDKLLANCEYPILLEVAHEVVTAASLSVADVKNSEGLSHSSSLATQEGIKTAASASA